MVSINKPVARSAMVALGCCAVVKFGQAWREKGLSSTPTMDNCCGTSTP